MSERLLNIFNTCQSSTQKNFLVFLQELSHESKIQHEKLSFCSELEQLYDRITAPFSTSRNREISKEQRAQKGLTHYQYNYGEITFSTIHKIIGLVRKYRPLGDNDVFYDLGSGSGKVLFAASLCHSFKACIGIQYLRKLYQVSLQLKNAIQEKYDQIQETLGKNSLTKIQLYNADFQDHDWGDGTVIFVSSTCYTSQMMHKIEVLCGRLSKGTVLITLSKGLEKADNWKLVEKFNGGTSWGTCTVFIHLRVR